MMSSKESLCRIWLCISRVNDSYLDSNVTFDSFIGLDNNNKMGLLLLYKNQFLISLLLCQWL